MKPNKEQLAILSELEMWAKKIKKETVRWEKEVNTVFTTVPLKWTNRSLKSLK